MAKKAKNEAPKITLTYREILSTAISYYGDQWRKQLEGLKKLEEIDPDTARNFMETSPWRCKLKAGLQLWEIETGEEYGEKYDV